MTPAPVQILYAGPLLAGVEVSLRYVAHVQAAPFQPRPRAGLRTTTKEGRVVECASDVRTAYYLGPTSEALARCSARGASQQLAVLVPLLRAHLAFLASLHGVVFVVDSQVERSEANVERFALLRSDLASVGRSLDTVPVVLQCNKRDLPNAMPMEELQALIPCAHAELVPSIASRGIGVFDALKRLLAVITREQTAARSTPTS